MKITLKQAAIAVVGIIGFGVAMAVRDELSGLPARALAAGIGAAALSIALFCAQRSSDSE
jgi:hypothetical protein